jgi:hypothetical protein
MFALLPVGRVLLTAVVDALDSSTGQIAEQPVLSVVIPRSSVAQLDFDRLDPSDTMEKFQRRGDLKASRKSETFQSITPLTPADIASTSISDMRVDNLVGAIRSMRQELKQEISRLQRRATSVSAEAEQPL